MKISFIFISIIIFVLNITSIFMYSLNQKFKKAFSAIVISLNINDLICEIYLSCIWINDIIFKDKFMVKEEIWRSGLGCFTALGIILWYTIQTQTVLIFLSLSRLMAVVHSIETKFKRLHFVVKSIVLKYVVSFLIAFLTTVYFKLFNGNLTISLCLPFVDPSSSVTMIKVITWLVIISQSVTSVVIIVMHINLVIKIKDSTKHIRKSTPDKDSNTPMIIQLITITTSNIMCCFLQMTFTYWPCFFILTLLILFYGQQLDVYQSMLLLILLCLLF